MNRDESGTTAVRLALEEARGLGHHWLGAEHLLLGLLAHRNGKVAGILGAKGMTLAAAQAEVARRLDRGNGPKDSDFPGQKWTPRALNVAVLADVEAERLGHSEPGGAHVLLALLRAGQSVALAVLTHFGVDLSELRREVLAAVCVSNETCDRYLRETEGYAGQQGRWMSRLF